MKHKIVIAFISLWLLHDGIAADQNAGKADFKTGEELIKHGDLEGAYRAFSFASMADPSNAKYASKKAEVGTNICNRMLDIVRNLAQSDPTSAYIFSQKALYFDPNNAAARREAQLLEQQAAAAQNALDGAYSAVYDGDAKKAQELLASASRFKNWHRETKKVGASFESVNAELQRLTDALQVKALVQAGNIKQAMDFMLSATQTADSTSFAGKSLAESRQEISHSLVNTAMSRPLSLTSFAERARLLAKASKLDPTDKELKTLESETTVGFLELLSKLPQQPQFNDPRSAARFHRGLLDATAEVLGSAYVGPAVSVANSYPALRTNLLINDPRSCLSLDDKKQLESDILNTLSPISIADKSMEPDLIISISDIECAKSDIPRSDVQSVNSIYAAAKTQLANPAYIQLQTSLSYAEANLNRAQAAYQADPSIVNGFIQGKAIGEVRQLRNQLASTSPYTESEVTQAYQYERFQASRAVEFKCVLAVHTNPTHHSYSVQRDVSASAQDRKQGVSGVLPADRTGAVNSLPGLRFTEDLAKQAHDSFIGKLINAVKSASAGYYAVQASSEGQPDGERLAAMLYLCDLAKGTEYEEPAEEMQSRFRNRVEVDPASLPGLAQTVKFKLPQQVVAPAPATSATSIETVLESVVSIETDQGISGAGFFIGPHCSVVTNQHVIANAKTIILRTSKHNLFVAEVLSSDPLRDLAYLTTNADSCKPLELQTGAPHIGTTVYAVGNPLGLEGTVTKGIVSANRVGPTGVKYVQIDASLNHGNSGGPLVNENGKVLGVDTFGIKDTAGLNFAVAADEIEAVFGKFLGGR